MATSFVSVSLQEYKNVVSDALESIGKQVNADCIYVYFYDFTRSIAVNAYEWCAEDIPSQPGEIEPTPFNKINTILNFHLKGETVFNPHYTNLEYENADNVLSTRRGIRSLALFPMNYNEQCLGFVGIALIREQRKFSETEVFLVEAFTAMLTCAEVRHRNEKERMELKKKYVDLVEQTSDWVWEVDAEGYFTYVNYQAERITGYTPSEMLGKTLFSFMATDEAERVKKIFYKAVQNKQPLKQLENESSHKDGHSICFETSGMPVFDKRGQVKGFRGITRDITARKAVEKELNKSEQKYREIIASMEEGYYEAGINGTIIYCNDAACRLTGYQRKELIGANYRQLFKNHRAVYKAFIEVYKSEKPNPGFTQEINRKDGRICFGEISISPILNIEGSVTGFRGVFRDVTERVLSERKLAYLSMHDRLTGVYNRTYFEEELRRLRNSREYPITVIYADVNGLKVINDAFGHEKGDELLKAAAGVLRQSLRSPEVIARVGGDEFAVVLVNTDEESGQKIVSRIRERIEIYNHEHKTIPLSLSIGLATANSSETSLSDLFKTADDLMYRDKILHSKPDSIKNLESLIAAALGTDPSVLVNSRRLAKLCRALGYKLDLAPHQLSKLTLLAKVHNLGKAGIPNHILTKQGKLNREEQNLIRLHPEKGYRIANASQGLSDVASLILKHHEWWDGNGYPLGLKGTEIPVECRILAVVDAYISMTGNNKYKAIRSNSEALAELKRCAATQFDPEVVKALLKLYKEIKYRAQGKINKSLPV